MSKDMGKAERLPSLHATPNWILAMPPASTRWSRDIRFALLAIVLVYAASLLGQLATYPNLAPWYAGLAKPSFNPPNWVFAPVWTVLFVLMAFAFWRILRCPAEQPLRYAATAAFLLQLALNAAWSWMFFGAHSPALGLLNIIPQWLAVVATVILFWRIDRLAGLALFPLAAWVGFACILNGAIYRLNG